MPDRPLYRIHGIGRHPWWFAAGTRSRFDLPDPRGTCYLAESASGAFVETFQDWIAPHVAIPRGEVSARRLSVLAVPRRLTLADCTASAALAFGVTAEMHAAADRSLTQPWALAFAAAKFDGVRFLVRHDPHQRTHGFAIFGSVGEAPWPIRSTEAISPKLLDTIEHVFRVRVR